MSDMALCIELFFPIVVSRKTGRATGSSREAAILDHGLVQACEVLRRRVKALEKLAEKNAAQGKISGHDNKREMMKGLTKAHRLLLEIRAKISLSDDLIEIGETP